MEQPGGYPPFRHGSGPSRSGSDPTGSRHTSSGHGSGQAVGSSGSSHRGGSSGSSGPRAAPGGFVPAPGPGSSDSGPTARSSRSTSSRRGSGEHEVEDPDGFWQADPLRDLMEHPVGHVAEEQNGLDPMNFRPAPGSDSDTSRVAPERTGSSSSSSHRGPSGSGHYYVLDEDHLVNAFGPDLDSPPVGSQHIGAPVGSGEGGSDEPETRPPPHAPPALVIGVMAGGDPQLAASMTASRTARRHRPTDLSNVTGQRHAVSNPHNLDPLDVNYAQTRALIDQRTAWAAAVAERRQQEEEHRVELPRVPLSQGIRDLQATVDRFAESVHSVPGRLSRAAARRGRGGGTSAPVAAARATGGRGTRAVGYEMAAPTGGGRDDAFERWATNPGLRRI